MPAKGTQSCRLLQACNRQSDKGFLLLDEPSGPAHPSSSGTQQTCGLSCHPFSAIECPLSTHCGLKPQARPCTDAQVCRHSEPHSLDGEVAPEPPIADCCARTAAGLVERPLGGAPASSASRMLDLTGQSRALVRQIDIAPPSPLQLLSGATAARYEVCPS
jgi:hypothetical protein